MARHYIDEFVLWNKLGCQNFDLEAIFLGIFFIKVKKEKKKKKN